MACKTSVLTSPPDTLLSGPVFCSRCTIKKPRYISVWTRKPGYV